MGKPCKTNEKPTGKEPGGIPMGKPGGDSPCAYGVTVQEQYHSTRNPGFMTAACTFFTHTLRRRVSASKLGRTRVYASGDGHASSIKLCHLRCTTCVRLTAGATLPRMHATHMKLLWKPSFLVLPFALERRIRFHGARYGSRLRTARGRRLDDRNVF